ncbi:hypothetical protein [Pseudomonas sp. 22 E 5]|nr:hypothetical protein [Pseudomonas sp. 22 E 5]CRM96872.1 hypothetical protein [Pseudomonas sp. 22 E 5]
MLGQLRVFFPDVPLLGGGHRHFHGGAHAVQQHDQCLWGDLFTEQRFVTHHHSYDAARGVGDLDGALDLAFVAFQVRADPDPEGHAQAELFRQLGDVPQGAVHRIGADVVRQLAHDRKVLTHLLIGGVLVFLRVLALLERRVGKPRDLLRPVGSGDRAVDQRPEAGEQRGNCQHHHQVESKFTRCHGYVGFQKVWNEKRCRPAPNGAHPTPAFPRAYSRQRKAGR